MTGVIIVPQPANPISIAFSGQQAILYPGQSMTVTATVGAGATSYAWYLDGSPIPGATAASTTITFSASMIGVHTLTLFVSGQGSLSSKSINFEGRNISTLDCSFEEGTIPAYFTSTGNAQWTISSPGDASVFCAKSGVIADNQTTGMALTCQASSNMTLTFRWLVSSDSSGDYLRFYAKGSYITSFSGTSTSTWTSYSYQITSPGTYTFEWRYTKNSSGSAGSDAVWIDNIVIQ